MRKFILNEGIARVQYEFSSANKFSYCMKANAVIVLFHDQSANKQIYYNCHIFRKKYRECMYWLSKGRAANVTAFKRVIIHIKRVIIHKNPSNSNKVMPKKLPWCCHAANSALSTGEGTDYPEELQT